MAKSYDSKRTIATGSLVFPYVFHWPQLPPGVLEPAPDPIFLLRRSYISFVLASGVGLEDIYAVVTPARTLKHRRSRKRPLSSASRASWQDSCEYSTRRCQSSAMWPRARTWLSMPKKGCSYSSTKACSPRSQSGGTLPRSRRRADRIHQKALGQTGPTEGGIDRRYYKLCAIPELKNDCGQAISDPSANASGSSSDQSRACFAAMPARSSSAIRSFHFSSSLDAWRCRRSARASIRSACARRRIALSGEESFTVYGGAGLGACRHGFRCRSLYDRSTLHASGLLCGLLGLLWRGLNGFPCRRRSGLRDSRLRGLLLRCPSRLLRGGDPSLSFCAHRPLGGLRRSRYALCRLTVGTFRTPASLAGLQLTCLVGEQGACLLQLGNLLVDRFQNLVCLHIPSPSA
jgi:hypothetical protein